MGMGLGFMESFQEPVIVWKTVCALFFQERLPVVLTGSKNYEN